MHHTASPGTSPLQRVTVAILAIAALLVGLLPLGAAPAMAAPGDSGVESLTVGIVYDGASVPTVCDDAGDTGVVATNDSVGFVWGGGFPEQGQTYTLTQTLPAGWTWDPAVIGQTSSDGTNGLYESTSALTDGDRTLTVVLTPLTAGLDIELRTLRAIPGPDAGATSYTPTLASTSVEGTEQTSASPIEVCSEPITTIGKRTIGNEVVVSRGGVPGKQWTFEIRASVPADAIGQQAGTTIAVPGTIIDTWDGPTSSIFEFVSGPATADWTAGTNSAEFTLDNPVAFGTRADIRYTVWWPLADLPAANDPALRVTNTAHADWNVPPATNDVQAAVNLNNVASPGGSLAKGNYSATASASPVIPADPAFGGPWTLLPANASQAVPTGALVMSRIYHDGVQQDGQYVAYSERQIIDEWNPAEQRLHSDEIWVSDGSPTPMAPGTYTIEYRSGGVWHAGVAAAGGLAGIDGVRVSAVGGTPVGQRFFLVSIPFDVVAPAGTRPVTDRATSSVATVASPTPSSLTISASYAVDSVVVGVAKTASAATIASGSTVSFDVQASVVPPLGADSASTGGLTITDTLPPNVVAYEVVGLDPFWTRQPDTTDPSGNTVLTFTHTGTVTNTDTIPAITIETETSVQAPASGLMRNTATVTALEGATARANADVAVFQANVIALTKSADVPTIQIGDPTVSWTTRWFNYQTASQGESYVVDVLPYEGDPRNTDFTGTFELSALELTSAAAAGVSVEYTTDAPATVAMTQANNPGGVINWQPVADLASPPADATAIRVVIADFASGDDGVGSLRIVGAVDGQAAGDLYVNTAFGYIGFAARSLAETVPAPVDVVSSTVSGRVVIDEAATGVYDAAMPGLADVTVGLFSTADPTTPIATVVTDADGAYEFEWRAGDYVVRLIDVPALYEPTFSTAGTPGDRTSAPVSVGLDDGVDEVNFGETLPLSSASVTKVVAGPFALDSTELSGATFTIAWEADNGDSGTVDLTSADAWTAELGDLPAGTVVTLTEEPVDTSALLPYVSWQSHRWIAGDGYTVSADGRTATVEIVPDTVPALTVENTFAELTGTFLLTKSVTGEGADRVPDDTAFVAEYSVDGGTTWTALPEMTPAAPTVDGPTGLRLGTTVLLREIAPPTITGVEWATPAFSGAGVTPAPDGTAELVITDPQTVDVLLTNPTSQRNGQFQVTKKITGDGEELLVGDPQFVVTYTYPGQAEPESLTLGAGELASSPLLPEGTEVTITEAVPEGGLETGATWGTPTFVLDDGTVLDNGATVVIEADTVLALTLENPTEAAPPAPPSNPLAVTGGTLSIVAAILATVLLAAGVLLAMAARRRREGREA